MSSSAASGATTSSTLTLDQIKANLKAVKVSDFKTFVSSFNLVGLSLSAMIGANLADITKAFTNGVLKPIVSAVFGATRGGGIKLPGIKLSELFSQFLSFGLTIGILYVIMSAFNLELKKPVGHVWISPTPY